jgi:hypothetical protein
MLLVALAAITAQAPPVTAPPPALRADPFYAKHVAVAGLPILSSAKVPDAALIAARSIVAEMLEHRPDIARTMQAMRVRIAVMAEDESTTDLPEQRGWTRPARDDPRLTFCERKHYDARIGRLTDRQYWNWRARGMGGVFTSAAAEDLLGQRTSRYYGETTFVHEFAHTIHHALRQASDPLAGRIEQAYRAALAAGRWRGEYAMTTADEYWAVGTQLWFNSKRLVVVDGRRILSDADLAAYDPALYAVLGAVYGARHRLSADPFYLSPARVPPGPPPASTAEIC